jgi:hypothetical protein
MTHYLDYLRLSTWNLAAYTAESARLRLLGAKWRKAKWLQYAGQKTDEYFHGIGQQNGKRHFILQASGPAASDLFDLVRGNEKFYCNRIDLQMTIQEPENYDARKVYDDVRTISGNTRNSSLILSNTGSTVYFGNRTSDSFVRCYQKDLDNKKFLRLELELKGITARYTYENLRLGNVSAAEAYNHLFRRFKKPEYLNKWFDINNEKNQKYATFEHLKYKNNKLEWLMSLENSIVMLGNDHATGQSVRTFLENCLSRIDAV